MHNSKENLEIIIDINEVKWSYKEEDEEDDSNKSAKNLNIINDLKWTPFNKLDSFNLEQNYRNNPLTNKIQVLDGLYEVNLETRQCKAIYWNGIINKNKFDL
jgi:hypothetical protein